MKERVAKIVFDCERMKYPNTGLYHFCKNLGQALIDKADASKELIGIYIQKTLQQQFIGKPNFINQVLLHKYLLPNLRGVAIWHATHQSTTYFPFRKKVKIILTIHDINFMHEGDRPQEKKDRELKKLQKKIDRADQVVAISDFVANDIKKYFTIASDKIAVIYNGCNVASSAEPSVPDYIPPAPFLFTIGTIVAKKNFHVLPALLANNDMYLVIAGEGNRKGYKEKIEAEALKWNVLNRVVFVGAISERNKYWYFANCKAFVFPSLMEGFGLPVVEAMSFGKPLFLSNQTSLPEIGGDCAFYFNDFEPQHMQQVLIEGLEKYDSMPSLQKAIAARAQFFSWQKTAEAYLELYHKVADNKK